MLTLMLGSVLIASASFAAMWAVCVRLANYGFLDVTWTLSIGLMGLLDGMVGSGDGVRRVLFTATGLAWSLRLGLFVLYRVARHHPSEDKRYRTLREVWKGPGAWLAFFELQAVTAVAFTTPFALAAVDADPRIAPLEWLGLITAGVGIVGEAVADHQSHRFKSRAGSATKILDVGLWRYSRHPNYFFEILTWLGFAVAALPLPMGWIAMVCPVLITYFLLRVTGVPLTEKHSIETHGEAYREYQRRTSAIIPWMRKIRVE
jgi:steroid 5-alpha reductase family enzyme